jgi:hypothetical protein
MRDTDTIGSELQQLVAICNIVREVEGRPPSTDWIFGLLDERRKLTRTYRAPASP